MENHPGNNTYPDNSAVTSKVIEIRKGQTSGRLDRAEFSVRFRATFIDPAFRCEDESIARLEEVAWQAYTNGRKAPFTQKAGPGYVDPDYELSVEWLSTKQRIEEAQRRWSDPSTPSRVLLICGSARNDGTCPGEMSKSFRLLKIVRETLEQADIQVDVLDLSLITSEYGRNIHPCKGCVSTAMPLCHWPCSCYPNHSLNQNNDWMAEIYERWTAAHAVIIVTPVYWYQSPSPLKLMIDRMVCADGGNPDPTSTSGKNAGRAKELEMTGWDYPQHLAGRAYGVIVHGDVAGIEGSRRSLSDWLDWMGFIDAGAQARLDRYIGYFEPYATSHDVLDKDTAVQVETRNVALAVAKAVVELRAGRLHAVQAKLSRPRPK
ncbi:NAD(P)H-dependent oxidoreductase [Nitrosomonas sp.]|uniref:flavodoxin family protein n=1 Tax=Nitrosomonas sp. TaxID=42353 RepID=UPI0025EED849|nr:NAD(P)H-dependent oxidoreductase [Nitrosomonas sp.]MBY0484082.1 flavodoxin family protein [Nitrosomonas sp.]